MFRCFFDPLDPGSGIEKKFGSVTGIPRSVFQESFKLKILKLFEADPDPGSAIFFTLDPEPGIFLTLDPGWKNLDPRSGINIPDPQHWFVYTVFVIQPLSGRPDLG